MGFSGKRIRLKSNKIKMAIINDNRNLEKNLYFIKIEDSKIFFTLEAYHESVYINNKTYSIEFYVPFFSEYESGKKYKFKEIKPMIDKNYNNIILYRTIWNR